MRTTYEFCSGEEVTIKGYCWKSEGPCRGVVVIAHGMAETIERYDDFAAYLNQNHYVVFGNDHRGHGQTACDQFNLGHLSAGEWHKMRGDLHRSVLLAASEHPGKPVYIMAHSMGSFLLRDYLLAYGDSIHGGILSGTGLTPMWKLRIAKGLAATIRALRGERYPSKLLHHMAFGKNNQRFSYPKTAFDWLSRDEDRVNDYINNPFCGNIHSAGFYHELATQLSRILKALPASENISRIPLLIISGKDDPVGHYGEDPDKVERFYADQGFETTLCLYAGGRHEMLQEINRQEVYSDIRDWLDHFSTTSTE